MKKILSTTFGSEPSFRFIFEKSHNWHTEVRDETSKDATSDKEKEAKVAEFLKQKESTDVQKEYYEKLQKLAGEVEKSKFEGTEIPFDGKTLVSLQLAEHFGELNAGNKDGKNWTPKTHPKTFAVTKLLTKTYNINIDNPKNLSGKTLKFENGKWSLNGVPEKKKKEQFDDEKIKANAVKLNDELEALNKKIKTNADETLADLGAAEKILKDMEELLKKYPEAAEHEDANKGIIKDLKEKIKAKKLEKPDEKTPEQLTQEKIAEINPDKQGVAADGSTWLEKDGFMMLIEKDGTWFTHEGEKEFKRIFRLEDGSGRIETKDGQELKFDKDGQLINPEKANAEDPEKKAENLKTQLEAGEYKDLVTELNIEEYELFGEKKFKLTGTFSEEVQSSTSPNFIEFDYYPDEGKVHPTVKLKDAMTKPYSWGVEKFLEELKGFKSKIEAEKLKLENELEKNNTLITNLDEELKTSTYQQSIASTSVQEEGLVNVRIEGEFADRVKTNEGSKNWESFSYQPSENENEITVNYLDDKNQEQTKLVGKKEFLYAIEVLPQTVGEVEQMLQQKYKDLFVDEINKSNQGDALSVRFSAEAKQIQNNLVGVFYRENDKEFETHYKNSEKPKPGTPKPEDIKLKTDVRKFMEQMDKIRRTLEKNKEGYPKRFQLAGTNVTEYKNGELVPNRPISRYEDMEVTQELSQNLYRINEEVEASKILKAINSTGKYNYKRAGIAKKTPAGEWKVYESNGDYVENNPLKNTGAYSEVDQKTIATLEKKISPKAKGNTNNADLFLGWYEDLRLALAEGSGYAYHPELPTDMYKRNFRQQLSAVQSNIADRRYIGSDKYKLEQGISDIELEISYLEAAQDGSEYQMNWYSDFVTFERGPGTDILLGNISIDEDHGDFNSLVDDEKEKLKDKASLGKNIVKNQKKKAKEKVRAQIKNHIIGWNSEYQGYRNDIADRQERLRQARNNLKNMSE